MIKRLFDLAVAAPAFVLLLPVMVVVAIAIRLDSEGPAIFWSDRFGRDGKLFRMAKFRTMRIDAPALPTHLLPDGESLLTRIGPFLRKSSLDELPQLWHVMTGEMSLVGPRPALFNQDDLIELRRVAEVAHLRPGITGWAQVNGRDELSLERKVAYERDYCERMSLGFDVKILFLTAMKVVRRDGIRH